jgi:hypothetical protein
MQASHNHQLWNLGRDWELASWRFHTMFDFSMLAGASELLELPRTEHGHHVIASSRVTLQYVLSRIRALFHAIACNVHTFTTHALHDA